jgi:hypothetical protein
MQSLDIKALCGGWNNYPSLSQDYLLLMSNQLKVKKEFVALKWCKLSLKFFSAFGDIFMQFLLEKS